ncbi:MAG TPA: hypothetical protein VGJ60_35860 [Chloroflexota bacterium]|jgi:hypothetical protein
MITNPDLLYDLIRDRQGAPLLGTARSRFHTSAWTEHQAERPLSREEATILDRFAKRLSDSRRTVLASRAYEVLTTGTFAVF